MSLLFILQEPIKDTIITGDRKRKLDDTAAKKERCAARQRKYYAANKEREAARQIKYRAENKCQHGKRKIRCPYCCSRSHICPNCKDWPDARVGMKKYDGMCYRCYAHEFPDDPKVQAKQRAEDTVKAYINAHFKDFVHDQKMDTAHCVCDHRRRIDHRRVVGNTLLCVETDEHHHIYYDKDDEDARYHDMLMGWGGKLCFVRFNPDDEGPPLEERLERLHAEITLHMGRLERGENSAYLEVWHLYYPPGTGDNYEEALAPAGL
jgi:hypothetical protein